MMNKSLSLLHRLLLFDDDCFSMASFIAVVPFHHCFLFPFSFRHKIMTEVCALSRPFIITNRVKEECFSMCR